MAEDDIVDVYSQIFEEYHGVYNRWSHDLPESIYDRRNDSKRQFQDTAHA